MTRMRNEEPVARVRMPHGGEGRSWLVTRYADVQTVTSDRRFSRAALVGMDFPRITPAPIAQDEALNLMDPPTLNRVRKLIIKAFTTPRIEALRPWVQRTVDELLDTMVAQGPPADLTAHLSNKLPLMTICQLMGIPEEDRPRLRRCAMAMMSMSTADRSSAAEAKATLRAYFKALSTARRRDPGDDLISSLATARIGEEMLGEEELAVMTMVLFNTGHDTTSYDITNITYTLLTHPEHLRQLRDSPELLPRAMEELLRYIPFRQGVGIPRVALEDVELSGVLVKAGDIVHVSYLTANRDGSVYECPDDLDFERKDPPAHMAFGYGSHHCLGAHLAHMVLQVSIGTLINRFPRLRLAVPPHEVEWNTTSIWRYPHSLPITW
jgi:cytochrome P450